MSRREIREQIFKLLFRAEFYEEAELPEQLQLFFEELDKKEEKDTAYIQEKFEQILSHMSEIDKMVNEIAQGWKTTRMGKVDLTLIRLAVYEMKFEEEVPTGVAINEAVELAKSYGTDDSASFVNGILAKLA
ncbi:transcription antitermination factor NusB [Petralouisia muris]|jgi:N utilization substance protein B|uniref:Transcription antitermination factor NusB n=1 Tax=Petralouisia muris TaxID=3032872 RepID=A0AC61RUN1_9FIRM|nr:transcription antitermination factor NusB [Petralouisia muris]TGY95455.1 transcription antitermination factor NusB [Petralouisia muris]